MGQKLLSKIKKHNVSFKDTVIDFTLPYQFMAWTFKSQALWLRKGCGLGTDSVSTLFDLKF